MTGTSCSIPDCAARHYARGWCVTHYRRWQRHGDPLADRPVQPRATAGTTYGAALRRVRLQRGPASDQACTECGAEAVCWSYDGADPDEHRAASTGVRYSLNPDSYRARCWFCHRRAATGRTELPGRARTSLPEFDVQRAIRLYEMGASCRGIGALMGVSDGAVRAALHAHGLTLRPSGRPRR